jgi:TPR repeat protein
MKYADGFFGVPQDFAKARVLLESAAAQDDNTNVAERAKSGLRYLEDLENEKPGAESSPIPPP